METIVIGVETAPVFSNTAFQAIKLAGVEFFISAEVHSSAAIRRPKTVDVPKAGSTVEATFIVGTNASSPLRSKHIKLEIGRFCESQDKEAKKY